MPLEPLENASEQTQDEIDLVAHCRAKVDEARASANRVAHEGIWMTNIAYLCGYNNIQYNTTSRRFEPLDQAQPFIGRPGISVNKILPTCQNRLARLCKNPPKYDVMPESNSQDDKDAARLSVDVLGSMWNKLAINERRFQLGMWVQQCGHAYVKVCWDPTLGKAMLDPATNKVIGYEGEVRVDVVSAFEIFPDPLAKTFEDILSSWLIHAKVRKLDYFKTQYPGRGQLVKAEDAWLLSAQYEQRVQSMNVRGPSESGMVEAFKNSAIEITKYEARSEKYPNGRMIISANGILLEDKALPVGEINFAKFDDLIVGGKYYPEAIITHLVPIQEEYNTQKRQRSSWINKLLAGKYSAARGTGLDQEAMDDDSGEVVYYDVVPGAPDGGRPTAIQVPMIPQYAYAEEDRLKGDFNDVSGISEVSRGQLPSASIPAIGMQLLTEQDDTRIGVETTQWEHAWARVGKLILKYVEKFYVKQRKLKMGMRPGLFEVRELKGSDLKGNTDVFVIPGSTLPGSKTLKRQEIINTWTQGLLGDPQSPEVRAKVLDMLEYGDVTEMWKGQSLDKAQIKRGLDQIEQGMKVEVNEADNHTLWFSELNDYRKTEKFLALSPEGKQALNLCMETHLQYLVEMMSPPAPPAPMPPPEMPADAEPAPTPQIATGGM